MIDLSTLTPRQLQMESALALAADRPSSNELSRLGKTVHHDSHQFYRAVIADYIERYGDLPSKAGPGASIKLLFPDA